jgi:hypothetical protein
VERCVVEAIGHGLIGEDFAQSHRATEPQSHRATEPQRHGGTESRSHRGTEAQERIKDGLFPAPCSAPLCESSSLWQAEGGESKSRWAQLTP